ncbi:tape measure protein [Devosia sp.]|uniref:tape measure protein n=1 Tax=Devosia sp. TaxID=1871048 RepID=UPI001ACEF260|nr:tape measure protein [Devosia sp.]MBN9333630.1 phage tail tape measure protein [Devosia sp.]
MAGEGDAERLVVLLEARTNDALKAIDRAEKKFDGSYAGMRRGSRTATQQMEADMLRTTTAINRAIAATSTKIGSFRGTVAAGLGGIGLALGASELIKLSDTWTDLNGRIQIAVGGMKEGTEVMGRLGDMARRTYSSLDATAESFLANSQALKDLGYSTNQQLDFTEALNNALVVSGAKGQRAEQVINALGKAMAFGELRGENLNTVIQTGGRVASALAEGLGVTTNELRKMGEQGKLTSDSVFRALTGQMGKLRDEADGMKATISDAFTLLRNAMLEYVGGADEAAGASARIAHAIIGLADNFDAVANAALNVATVLVGALAGRALVTATLNVVSLGKALRDFVVIARTAQGVGGLSSALGALGGVAGPVGLIVGGAAALALGHFANQAFEAEQRTTRFNATLDRMGLAAKESAEQIDAAAEAQKRLATAEGLAAHQQETEDATAKLAEFEAGLEDLAGVFRLGAQAGFDQQAAISKVVDEYQRNERSADSLGKELDELATKFPDWASDIASIQGWVSQIETARTAVSNLAAETQAMQWPALPGPTNPRGALGASRREMATKAGIGADYVTEQERLLSLTKEQRDVEEAIARIVKDVAAAKGTIAPEEAERLARLQVAAQNQRSARGASTKAAKDENDAVKELIASLEFEKSLLGKSAVEQEKMRAVRQAGGSATGDQVKAIERLVTETYNEQMRIEQLQDAFDLLGQMGMSAVNGIIDALADGKISAEEFGSILSNVLSMAGNYFLGNAFNSLGSIFTGGAGGVGGVTMNIKIRSAS